MRLLLITQKMDANDAVLGFMHRWAGEFSKYFGHVEILCLEKGEVHLPGNSRVTSLGKESGRSRIKYIYNFYRYIFSEQHRYDSVLVHMNQEYVILGGIFWYLMNKRVFMWRNHYSGSWLTKLAGIMCAKIFFTSKSSYTADLRNSVMMPVGIDTEFFSPQTGVNRKGRSILFLGRIAPSKRPNLLVEALGLLKSEGEEFTADFIGEPLDKDREYFVSLKKRTEELGLSNNVSFGGKSKYSENPGIYGAHEIFVNLSPSGMYDKTIFEAASCGCISIASSKDYAKLAGEFTFEENDALALKEKIKSILRAPNEEKEKWRSQMRDMVVRKHSLSSLAQNLYSAISSVKPPYVHG